MNKLIKSLAAAVIGMAAVATSLQAAPALRKPVTIQQPNGTSITIVQQGDEWCHWVTDLEGQLLVTDAEGNYHVANAKEKAEWEKTKARNLERRDEINSKRLEQLHNGRKGAPAITQPGENHAASFPSKGQIHGLIVLVEYSDVEFKNDSATTMQHYQDMINKEGYNEYSHQGSAHDFFYQNSMGQFDPQFDIYGPIKLEHNRKYYGGNGYWDSDQRPHEMIIEACEQLDSLVDFSIYDNNGDGIIDFVFAFYAGPGEHADGGKDCIWPHAWDVNYGSWESHYFDGVQLASYACSCETIYNQYDGVGTFCHEFTHVLGLPDIYDVNYSYNTFTPGDFDVLDAGSYNGETSGSCPAGVNTYERYELGWIEPEPLNPGSLDTLTYLGNSNRAKILPVKSSTSDPRDGEYYLFENRQKVGWDSYLPGHGMLVWHIDYQEDKWNANNVNTTSYHQGVDIIEADNSQSDYSRSGDPFPGSSGNSKFNATSKPALLAWENHNSHSVTKPLNGAAFAGIREEADSDPDAPKRIIYHYTDNTVVEATDTLESGLVNLLKEEFYTVLTGSDASTMGQTLPFKGNANIVECNAAYQAGSAIRLGKALTAGSIITRPLGNAEGDSLHVEIMVKGWSKVEGTLLVSTLDGEEEPVSLEYTSTIADGYELVSCTLYNCKEDTQLKFETSNKRCFIKSIHCTTMITPPSSIGSVLMDEAPAKHSANKVWRNGQLLIQTSDGLFNMQGVRQ